MKVHILTKLKILLIHITSVAEITIFESAGKLRMINR